MSKGTISLALNLSDPNLEILMRTDKAEVFYSDRCYRYSGWNGNEFMSLEVSSVSIAESVIYRLLFENNGIKFYRLKDR